MDILSKNNNNNKKLLLIWLWTLLSSVFLMVIIGGITRLTDSGLSMVEWRPILGFFPPMNETEWYRIYDLYKSTPEYKFYNTGISLSEFKYIFFWEYFHRLWGRIIGLIFIIPFTFFLIKKILKKREILNLIFIFALGLIQGLIGWWMVESGLTKDPYVSQYRLALHLTNAFLIMFAILWLIMDFHEGKSLIKLDINFLILIILSITIIAGSIVAGMDAGLMYNTYPLMNGKIFPDQYGELGYLDAFENPGSAQFHHRHLGLLSFISLIFFYFKNFKIKVKIRLNFLLIITFLQFFLGIFILLNYVPIAFASLHQIGAMILFLILTSIIHTQNIKN